MVSTPLSPAKVREYDAVVIATAHAVVDYSIIARHAVLIIDTRNAIHKAGLTARCRLVKA
jgi:UDP-N-acetyl-D-glucosamine dehydrogenase